MLVLGSSDLSVAEYSADLWLHEPLKYIIVSGGYGKVTKDLWSASEARKFADVIISKGISKDLVFLEETATNTGDNIAKSRAIITSNSLPHSKGVIVTKPYMKRRAFNTAMKQWSEVEWYVTAEPISFEEYLSRQEEPERFISIMVGDLQRIELYGEQGFQIRDNIPAKVNRSLKALINMGYTQFLITT